MSNHPTTSTELKRKEIKSILANPELGVSLLVKGWVRAFRNNRFIVLNDGSSAHNLQAVIVPEEYDEDFIKRITFHSCVSIIGKLEASQGAGQDYELIVEKIEILGDSDASSYVLQPKKQSLEFLREKAHLRMRTNTFSSVFRIRHGVSYAVHKYFHDHGFYSLHSPIITGSDAEGAGEMFRVTTFEPDSAPLDDNGQIDWSQDFFGKPTNLTVSGQLQAEIGALALGKVYTFGPTFRAENSNTSRHLAEFWMIEPEVAFADIHDNMDLAEDFLKFLINFILDEYYEDLEILDAKIQQEEKNLPKDQRRPMPLIETLKFVVSNDFERITYSQAIHILRNSKPFKKKKFAFEPQWGEDLAAEHERYLVEKHFKKPVIVRDYPKKIKAFYMKENEPQEFEQDTTVAAMDVLFPYIGEVIGGSQREDRVEKLEKRMLEMDISAEELFWYVDLRKFGGCPHSGFGLGFERIVLFITGMSNIRDVIPFPRTPGNAKF